MHFSLASILAFSGLLLSGASASPVANHALEARDDCISYARLDSVWHENAMSRRRVYYDTDKPMDNIGDTLKALGEKWDDEPEKCSAVCNNQQVYFHETVEEGGAYVVDSNEVLGVAGDNAFDCLLDRFRDLLSRELGCRDES